MILSIKDFITLTKFRLSFVVTSSMVFSFILIKESISIQLLAPFIAVLLLALGVSALNQYQEYEEDAKMQRTKHRPIASNKITPQQGLRISILLIAISFLTIYFSLEFIGIYIFISVIVLYNFVYTKIKKTTVYAAVYGAVLGITPPMIGWLAGGGDIYDIRFFAIALFYFIWQIPHFWLLILKYHKQYHIAGFPTVAQEFGIQRLERITFIWLLLTVICGVFVFLAFPIRSDMVFVLFLLLVIYTLYSIFSLLKTHKYIKVFVASNIYITFTMCLLTFNILL